VALDSAEAAQRQRWVSDLAAQLCTRKVALIRRRGGFTLQSERRVSRAEKWQLALEGNTLSLVNLKTDAELLHGELLGKLDRELLSLAQEILLRVGGLMVSVTSPLDLLRELFTVRGAGTLIKQGSEINRYDSYRDVDQQRLAALFDTSFERKLGGEFFAAAPRVVYVEQDYRGAAVVTDTPIAPYLSKFAVEPAARGEGMGRDLWTHLSRDFPTLFWRTRADNPTRAWYTSVCDTLVRRDRWHVFLRGIEPEQIAPAVRYAEALGDDFEP
jgi:acetylglutamate kinase